MKLVTVRTGEDLAGGSPLNLEDAIAEFYRDFPEFKKEVFILNHQKFATGQEAVKSIAADLDALQKECPSAKMGLPKSMAAGMFAGKLPCSVNITESMLNQKPDMPIFGRIVIPAGDEFSARLLKSIFVSNDPVANTHFPVMNDEYNNTEMWHRYVLDHELGHAVTQIGLNKLEMKVSSVGNRAECEADAYSMIRHYQRYGHDSTFPEFVRDLRNMNALHKGDVTHWTVRALNEVIELNREGKLKDLTPHQARDLAVDIAARCHLSADAENNMSEAFAETRAITQRAAQKKWSDGEKAEAYLDKAAELAAETKSQGVREACLYYLSSMSPYIPESARVALPEERLSARAQNAELAKTRVLGEEPPMGGLKRVFLKRVFRDAMIDFQSGQTKPANDAPAKSKKPKGPKAA
jgi:hypothetical protein